VKWAAASECSSPVSLEESTALNAWRADIHLRSNKQYDVPAIPSHDEAKSPSHSRLSGCANPSLASVIFARHYER
jgi:hypothetical protein